ncbi:cytolethal distending toxin subunit B family protein [Yersinia vastinensis]|uniref:cytolethal distending toxin subunit B family protein n=1 Tax=Yersinia vastinensis TaxID=2890318 RepID=UPI0005E432A4|nr:cytolethal distending toxin subunit B family protein [Yersinia vastinensis]OVZ98193.1 toxin [Yersinia frederiksenii]CNI06447.1 cytolethal distending toxin subunit B [Yersinia frederiksenii]
MKKLFKGIFYSLSILCMAAQADITDYKLASWNMQGAQSGHGSHSKWVTSIMGMLTTHGMDIISLQETGAAPPTAIVLPVLTGQHSEIERRIPRTDVQVAVTSLPGGSDTVINPSRRGVASHMVQEYLWNVGTTRRPNDFYIYHFDRGRSGAASRINLAIVSRARAEEIIIVPPMASGNNTRPTLGIRLGNDYFFSIHAEARSNNEAPQIVQFINNYMTSTVQGTRPEASWIVMGDYNRTPDQLTAALDTLSPALTGQYQIISPNQMTQQSNRTIDYAVMGRLPQANNAGALVTVPLIAALLTYASDHMAVRYLLK